MNFNFFKRKTQIRLEDFCKDYYEKNILISIHDNIDFTSIFIDNTIKSIAEVDNRFANINFNKFLDEMTIVRLEIFAIAWFHRFGDSLAVKNSIFTRDYLHSRNRDDIWENSESYNQAVARSSTLGKTYETTSGKEYLVFINKMRIDLFNKFTKDGTDSKCVARALNRFSTEVAWKNNITPGFLILNLCDRLICEINNEAQFRLVAILIGFYQGACQSFNNIKIIK
jgi:hypothetical protein